MLPKAEKLPEEWGLPRSLEIYRIPTETDEWHEFRKRGIGGSEIGYLLGLSDYKSAIQVYYDKIGVVAPFEGENEAQFHGKVFEEHVGQMWEYYDGTEMGYIENFRKKKKIRRSTTVNGYIVNPKYPYLFASLDRLMLPGQVRLTDAKEMLKAGVVEVKNISSMYANKWEAGIPPQYLAQVMQYMIVLELDYAEIILLRDGRYLSVRPVLRDEEMCQHIINSSKEFWETKIIPAKKIMETKLKMEADNDIEGAEECESMIHSYEPEPDHTEAYKDYMSSRLLFAPISTQGTDEAYDVAWDYKKWHEVVKRAESLKLLEENKLRKIMLEAKADEMTFEDKQKITMKVHKGKSKSTLKVSINTDFEADDFTDKLKNTFKDD